MLSFCIWNHASPCCPHRLDSGMGTIGPKKIRHRSKIIVTSIAAPKESTATLDRFHFSSFSSILKNMRAQILKLNICIFLSYGCKQQESRAYLGSYITQINCDMISTCWPKCKLLKVLLFFYLNTHDNCLNLYWREKSDPTKATSPHSRVQTKLWVDEIYIKSVILWKTQWNETWPRKTYN